MSNLGNHELHILLKEAKREAARLCHRLPDHEFDREDFVQDLLAELLQRLAQYDRSRGDLGAFAGIVVRHRGTRLRAQYWRRRRTRGAAHLPLDTADEEGLPLAEILPESRGIWFFGDAEPRLKVECAAAVETVLGSLDATERKLCEALSSRPVRSLVGTGWGSRSTIYRRIAALRPVFLACGVSPEHMAGYGG